MNAGHRPYFAAYYRWLVIQDYLIGRTPLRGAVHRLLDVGCDDGYIARNIKAQLRVGVDHSPRLQPSQDFAVVRANVEHLPLLDGQFDGILAFDILEHVVHDRAVMREMLRVLSPHGILWFSTPARETTIFPWFLLPYANRSFGHVRNGYTPEQLAALLPDPNQWEITVYYWNEPMFRRGLVFLHLLDRIVPSVAAILTWLCFQLDKHDTWGHRGHLLGMIRRRSQDKETACELPFSAPQAWTTRPLGADGCRLGRN